jgi:L-asparaginase II
LGITLKVEDGDLRAAAPALMGVLDQVLRRCGGGPFPVVELAGWDHIPIRNTRGQMTGEIRAAGRLHFSDHE